MADELRTGTPEEQVTPSAQPTTTTSPSGHIDPEEYYALQGQVARYEAAFERLNPQADRIKRLVEDPDAQRIFDDAVSAMEAMKARNAPEVPAEFKPIYDKVSKLEEFADRFTKQQEEIAQAPQREFTQRWQEWQNSRENNRFYDRLRQEQPDLKPRDLQYLAQVAAEKDFAPLEEIWKENSWRFNHTKAAAPPASLRADAGDVGIPAPSESGKAVTMRDRIAELERARRGA